MPSREALLVIGAAVASVVGGYALGRHSAPDRVELRERVVYQDRIVTKVEVQRETVASTQADEAKDVRTVYVTKWLPGGAVEQTATTEDKSRTEEKTAQSAAEHETKAEERIVYRDRETSKVVERGRPAWSVALLPGIDVRNLFERAGWQMGISAERRLFGPVLVGAWGNTAGAGGLSLRVEF